MTPDDSIGLPPAIPAAETSPAQIVVPSAAPAIPAGWFDFQGRQRWWDGTKWTEHWGPTAAPTPVVVVQQAKRTNHVLHLLLSIFTFGLWIPVWIIVAIANA